MSFFDALRDWRAAETRALKTVRALREHMASNRQPLPPEATRELHKEWQHASLLLKAVLTQAAADAYQLRHDK